MFYNNDDMRCVMYYMTKCYCKMHDYFKKIPEKIFLNNLCLTFNFTEL